MTTHAAKSSDELIIGVLPFLSTRAVLSTFKPLRGYLENHLGRPVQIYTASDYRNFVRHTQQGDYDLVITTANFARLAQIEAHYNPILSFKRDVVSVVVVPKNSTIKDVTELRGKSIAFPDKAGMVSILAFRWFRERGLQPDVDFKILQTGSHTSTITAMQRGDSIAAVSSVIDLQSMPREVKDSVRVLASTGKSPNFIFLTNPKVSPEKVARIKELILSFANKTTAGKLFLEKTGFEGIIPVNDAELKSIDTYMKETKFLLERP